jgi:hypothetical protein
MSDTPSDPEFVLRMKLDPEDLAHAQSAHAVWATVAGKPNTVRSIWLIVLVVVFLGIPVALLFLQAGDVQVSLAALVGLASLPTFLILFVALYQVFPARPTDTLGVIERELSATGHVVPNKTNRRGGLLGPIFFFALATGIFLIMQIGKRSTPPPAAAMTLASEEPTLRRVPGMSIFIASGIFALAGIWLVAKILRWQFKRMGERSSSVMAERTWEASEERLVERDPDQVCIMQWSHVRKFVETPRMVLLYPDDLKFYPILRSSFESDEQYERFIGLLMRKVPNGILQPRKARGFMVQPIAPAAPHSA